MFMSGLNPELLREEISVACSKVNLDPALLFNEAVPRAPHANVNTGSIPPLVQQLRDNKSSLAKHKADKDLGSSSKMPSSKMPSSGMLASAFASAEFQTRFDTVRNASHGLSDEDDGSESDDNEAWLN